MGNQVSLLSRGGKKVNLFCGGDVGSKVNKDRIR